MAVITRSLDNVRESFGKRFNWEYFLQDNLTGSWGLMAWVTILSLLTLSFSINRLRTGSLLANIALILWVVGVVLVVTGELRGHHNAISRWVKENLFSSISNTILSLFLLMFIAMLTESIVSWAFINATFDPERTAAEFRPEDGATWGVISGARKLLATGRLNPEHTPRVVYSLALIIGLWALTFVSGREQLKEQLKPVRSVVNILWLLSPFVLYIFLAGLTQYESFSAALAENRQTLIGVEVAILLIYGILWQQKVVQFNPITAALWVLAWPIGLFIWLSIGQTGIFPTINVDTWGGLLYTLILAVSVNLLSFPLGLFLALGRRSNVQGIPAWIVWPVAIGATAYLLNTQTPELLATSRNTFEQITSYWPILIIGVAYLFMRMFNGNMLAGASTFFIEIVRGVPLITLLFMAIVMAKFFFEDVTLLKNAYAAIVGYTLFSSAYMAETVRGGLQAIQKGQFEAADALGFNTLQKYRFIILPQALRIVIPALVGQFIGTFKSSSLVAIVGLFDLTGIVRAIISNDAWLGLRRELYVFIAVVYFVGSALMSWYSRRLETRLGVGER